MSDDLPFDPKNSVAVLFGVSKYPKGGDMYQPVQAAKYNIRDFEQLLRDPNIFGFEKVYAHLDPKKSDILKALIALKESPDYLDTLLVYYCGHGVKEKGEYYITGKDLLHELPADTSIKFEVFEDLFLTIAAERRVLILDSCYSGAALGKSLGADIEFLDVNIQNMSKKAEGFEKGDERRKGLFAIASAGQNVLADADLEDTRHTGFTGILIKRLKDGFPKNEKTRVTMRELVRLLKADAKKAEIPTPRESDKFGLGSWHFVGNSSPLQRKTTVISDQIQQITDNITKIIEERIGVSNVQTNNDKQSKRQEVNSDSVEKKTEPSGDPVLRFHRAFGIFGDLNIILFIFSMILLALFIAFNKTSIGESEMLKSAFSLAYAFGLSLMIAFIIGIILNIIFFIIAITLDEVRPGIIQIFGSMRNRRWALSGLGIISWSSALVAQYIVFQ